MKIAGGVAVITGGAGGIGFELAKLLLSKGCSVSICDNSEVRGAVFPFVTIVKKD
eukprot:CAMPEP_0184027864 /NCGR_PEP_ID=MMETSP0954-20121128/14454_1 /TAXON_ID=627963 /ORGANISM="Aplanochytrium sp, Strain PBS07" /LENGTH=54 /DNA_ID=CAMNT_0026312509 /DNA_START=57 /DNA_END=221 /DNA_ORIENTATION=-